VTRVFDITSAVANLTYGVLEAERRGIAAEAQERELELGGKAIEGMLLRDLLELWDLNESAKLLNKFLHDSTTAREESPPPDPTLADLVAQRLELIEKVRSELATDDTPTGTPRSSAVPTADTAPVRGSRSH
jgi:hypothetical protein